MEGRESLRIRIHDLFRYFGFTIIAVVALVVSFIVISERISKEIQKVTYQVLEDSTRQERASLQKFFDLLVARTNIIADYEANTGPNTIIESLRTELKDSVSSAEIGFANRDGYLLYSDQTKINVSGESWFQDSLNQGSQIAITSQNRQDDQVDILVASPVYSRYGVNGVLFVTIDGSEIANIIQTLAYDGNARTFICDSSGIILFCEPNFDRNNLGKSIFEFASHITLQEKAGVFGLAAALKRGITTGYTFEYRGSRNYAVTAPIDVLDWRIVTLVSSDTADTAQRQVNLYLIGMLIVMLAVGVSMAIQAYVHEQATVRKLEKDKGLLRQSAERYKIITKLSNEVLFQVDWHSGAISFNDNFEGMFGFPAPVCTVDQIDNCLPLIAEVDRDRFFAMMQKMQNNAKESHEELRMVQSRGVTRWKRIDIYSIFDQNGHTAELVGKIVDVHRQKQSMQRLIRQADSDPLTGLFNRASMERNIKEFLAGEGLRGNHALLMMDFDNFKAVNDTLGHAKGDDLLVSFAAVIRHVFRSGDFSSRIGGDEYMVFLKNISEDNVAREKAEELRAEMAVLSKKIGVPVSVSIGIALYPRDADNFEHLYKAADDALYYVKNHGKNSVTFHSALDKPDSKMK